jgi:peptidoglycan-N-acetylglucosamine deacetylase
VRAVRERGPRHVWARRAHRSRTRTAVTVGVVLLVVSVIGGVTAALRVGGGHERRTAPASTLSRGCARGTIALTFDDGPDRYTPQVLETLRTYNVQATFFVIGMKVVRHPDLIKAEIAAGHRVENHTWDHPHLARLPAGEALWEMSRTTSAIEAAGAPAPRYVRPPYGDTNPLVAAAAARLRLKIVKWTIDTDDWRGRSSREIVATVLDHLRPGAVVLAHDGLRETPNTVAALPSIINGLRQQGYCTGFLPEVPR